MSRIAAGVLMCAVLATPALAQDRSMTDIAGYEPSALEIALPRLESRLAEFGRAVEALEADDGLSDVERQARIGALWAEYGPDVGALAGAAAGFGVTLAGTMIESMDLEAVVQAALAEVDPAAIEAQVAAALAQVEAGHTGFPAD